MESSIPLSTFCHGGRRKSDLVLSPAMMTTMGTKMPTLTGVSSALVSFPCRLAWLRGGPNRPKPVVIGKKGQLLAGLPHLGLFRIRRCSWAVNRPESRTAVGDSGKVGLELGWGQIGAKLVLRANRPTLLAQIIEYAPITLFRIHLMVIVYCSRSRRLYKGSLSTCLIN